MQLMVSFRGEECPLPVNETDSVGQLQELIRERWNVAPENQKLLSKGIRGLMRDPEANLGSLGLVDGARVMLIGSVDTDIRHVQKSAPLETTFSEESFVVKWEHEEKHAKIVAQGLPDAKSMSDDPSTDFAFPPEDTIVNLRNQFGRKCRIKFYVDHLRFFTDSGMIDLPYHELLNVQSENIDAFPGRSIVRFTTKGLSMSKVFHVYFVPTKYVKRIKICCLG